MVWAALLYAGAGSWLAWRVGRPLIRLHVQRYEKEAEFRFGLVRVSESAEAVALYGGEKDERRYIDKTFDGVLLTMRRIVFAVARLTWVTSGYGWIAIVVPTAALPAISTAAHARRPDDGGGRSSTRCSRVAWSSITTRIADFRALLHRVVVFDE
jgi:ABC-type uncharacterized transport system fused permease/ATPase subunit